MLKIHQILFCFLLLKSSSLISQKVNKIDYLEVDKSERKLFAYYQNKLIKTYKIALGGNPKGHKQFEGDQKTPEGIYSIESKNPNSDYHKNLGVSYPNEQDIKFAKAHGKSPGGAIKIHGLPIGWGGLGKYHYLKDWTLGCIAVNNDEIDELYKAVKIGTKIKIKP